ncbi:30S ribosomal protein S1 [Bacillus sp. BRMEA1]|uniref:hypothetical protein n=1 Tax=Neobacillus endophyticus TaxID=2738405 RepID=UPI00156449FD|nr:hypothetical protein [Neobacillus endophyticus]NRD80822.1 30S ribosomal protein S1 [Neobacillus endophyticus]
MESLSKQLWSQDDLETLARIHRNQEVVQGMVQSVGFITMPVPQENGKMVSQETEVAIFRLEGGVKAYCPASEFSQHSFKTLNGFVGTIQNLMVIRLDLEHQLAIVSVKKADQFKRENFWNTIKYLDKKGELQNEVFEGVVWGLNEKNERIHCRIDGTDCFMLKYDWDWNNGVDLANVERGMKIQVKVLRFDESLNIIQVSRKDTMPDPYKILEQMKEMEVIVGRVHNVHPIHGIFVNVEQGARLKALKPRHLPEPLPGEIVSCRIREIDAKNRKGKVVIIDYPQGKKKRNDIGSFLFE